MNQRPIGEHDKHSYETYLRTCHYGLSWGAVVAGAFVAIGISFLLDLFGLGIGLSAYSTATTENGATALAFGGYVGILLGVMVAMFVAGCVSGFIARPKCTHGCHGVLYGFLAWCLALMLSFVLTTATSQFVSYHYRVLSSSNIHNIMGTSDRTAPAVQAASDRHASNTTVVVNDEKAAKAASKTVFLLFLLFFAGALSACFGGYTAVKRCRTDEDFVRNHK